MATETAEPKAEKKAKQQFLPGTEPERNKKIERLADRYTTARDEWQSAHKPMMDAYGLLETAMKEAKLTSYELPDGRVVEITVNEKLRVRKAKGAEDDE